MNFFLKQKLPDSNGNPIKIYLNKNVFNIGRKKKLKLQKYVHVSRKHATIYKTTYGTFLIKDLNSSNGLYVNGLKVDTDPQPVHVGDIIGFGNPCLDETGGGFVCMLCVENTADPKFIDITDDNDEDKPLCNSFNHSDFNLQTASNTCPELICIDLDDKTQHFSSCNKLNENSIDELSDSSSSKSCDSCSNSVNKADLAKRDVKFLNRDNTDNTSICDKTDDNDEHKPLCNSFNHSDYNLRTASNTCPELICIDLDDETQHLTNGNKLNASELCEISDSSSSKSCDSISNSINKIDHAERNAKILNKDNTDITSITLQNFLNIPREIMPTNCCVRLERCDSELFEWPPVHNPIKEVKLVELRNESPSFLNKKRLFPRELSSNSELLSESPPLGLKSKLLKRLSSDSSHRDVQREIIPTNCCARLKRCDSEFFEWPPDIQNPIKEVRLEELRSESPSFLNKKRLFSRELSSNSESPPLGIKRKPLKRLNSESSDSSEEIESSDLTPKEYLETSLNIENFQNVVNEINDDIINRFVGKSREIAKQYERHQENEYKSVKCTNKEANYSQYEGDTDNQSEYEPDIFDDSDCLPYIIKPDDVETIETIKEFLEKCIKTVEVDVSDKRDLELECYEITSSSNNNVSKSLNGKFNLNEQKSIKDDEGYCDLDHEFGETSDSDDNESRVLGSVTFHVGSKLAKKSSAKYETHEGRNSILCNTLKPTVRIEKSVKKSFGKTLLTKPESLIPLPHNIRGKKEGFREQKKCHKPTQCNPLKNLKTDKHSSTKLEIKIGEISFSKRKYESSHKSKIQSNKNHTDVNTQFPFKNSSDGVYPCSSDDNVTKRKVHPIRIRLNENGAAAVLPASLKKNTK